MSAKGPTLEEFEQDMTIFLQVAQDLEDSAMREVIRDLVESCRRQQALAQQVTELGRQAQKAGSEAGRDALRNQAEALVAELEAFQTNRFPELFGRLQQALTGSGAQKRLAELAQKLTSARDSGLLAGGEAESQPADDGASLWDD